MVDAVVRSIAGNWEWNRVDLEKLDRVHHGEGFAGLPPLAGGG